MPQHRVHVVFAEDMTEATVTCETWSRGERTHAYVWSPRDPDLALLTRLAADVHRAALPQLWDQQEPFPA